jgi:hypothetical protein
MPQHPEARCLICGTPSVDHLPLRYVVRAWVWHRFHTLVERIVSRPLSRLVDCGIDF